MDQHICLFYLADKLSVPKLQEFYHRMCSALNYSARKYDSYYLLYDTQYHVFHDTPLTDSRKKALGKIASCANCHAICKKNIYKQYQIEDNACILCKLSPLYRNGRIQSESTVLRRYLEQNAQFDDVFLNPSMSFNSCVRLAHDYAIGTFPILQLHAFLYSYLKQNNGYGDVTKAQFLDGFVLYLLSKVSGSSDSGGHIDAATFKDLVAFQLGRLYGIDPNGITSDLWLHEVDFIKGIYTYVAPLPAYKGTPVCIEQKAPEQEQPPHTESTQYSLLDVISGSPNDLTGSTAAVPSPNMYNDSTYPDISLDTNTANSGSLHGVSRKNEDDLSKVSVKPSGSKKYEDDRVFDSSDLPEIPADALNDSFGNTTSYEDFYPDEDIPIGALEVTDDMVPPELFYDDTDSRAEDAAIEKDVAREEESSITLQAKDEASNLLLPSVLPSVIDACIEISDNLFEGAVYPLVSDKCFSFSEHVLRSSFVCIEPATCFKRFGFLIFVPDDMRTYFFDVDLYGTDMLESLLIDETLDVFTMHTMGVLSLFVNHHSSFHKLCPLDLILASKWKLRTYEAIAEKLSWGSEFYHYMPSYPRVYSECLSHATELSKSLRKKILLYQVLARNDCLEFINPRIAHNLITDDLCSVRFKYRLGMEIHQKGFLYIIELPTSSLSSVIASECLFSDILLIMNALPHLHRKKAFLLSAESSRLVLFYVGSQDGATQFYDLFLAQLQSSYLKRFGNPMLSNSYCYRFDKQ